MRNLSMGLGLLTLITPALAAPKAKPARPPAAIDVTNQRTVGLKTFEIVSVGDKPKTVAKLTKPLAAGGKTKITISGAKGCDHVAKWQFEDAGDEAPIDLCHDPKVVLTD